MRTYAKGNKPDASIAFSADTLPQTKQVETKTLGRLQDIEKQFQESLKAQQQAELERKKSEEGREALEAEIKRLQDEIASVKKVNAAKANVTSWRQEHEEETFYESPDRVCAETDRAGVSVGEVCRKAGISAPVP